jgi:hypothetical protein
MTFIEDSLILSSSQNVYVNVTWYYVDDISTLASSQNVYVNVTWDVSEEYQVRKLFMWMLHDGL